MKDHKEGCGHKHSRDYRHDNKHGGHVHIRGHSREYEHAYSHGRDHGDGCGCGHEHGLRDDATDVVFMSSEMDAIPRRSTLHGQRRGSFGRMYISHWRTRRSSWSPDYLGLRICGYRYCAFWIQSVSCIENSPEVGGLLRNYGEKNAGPYKRKCFSGIVPVRSADHFG